MVPEDTVSSCLVAVLLTMPLQGFFPCWQQGDDDTGLKTGTIIPT